MPQRWCFYPSAVHIWNLANVLQQEDEKKDYIISDAVTGDVMTFSSSELVFIDSDGVLQPKGDLLDLPVVHEATVLHWLRKRLEEKRYSNRLGRVYLQFGSGTQPVCSCAAEVYYNVISGEGDQVISILGSTGSDKQLFTASSLASLLRCGGASRTTCAVMQAALSLLRWFGSVRTTDGTELPCHATRWNMSFNKRGSLASVSVDCEMLESSRILSVTENERLFTAAYMLLAGKEAGKYHAASTIFPQIADGTAPDSHDKAEYERSFAAFDALGIESKQRDNFWRVLSASLHVGALDISRSRTGKVRIATSCVASLRLACSLLSIEVVELERVITAADEPEVCRDTIACCLYHTVFHYIVHLINTALHRLATETTTDSSSITIIDAGGVMESGGGAFGIEEFVRHALYEVLEGRYRADIIEKPPLESFSECRNSSTTTGVQGPQGPSSEHVLQMLYNTSQGLVTALDEPISDDEFHKLVSTVSPLAYTEPRDADSLPVVLHHTFGAIKYDVRGFLSRRMPIPLEVVSLLSRATPLGFKNVSINPIATLHDFSKTTVHLLNTRATTWVRCVTSSTTRGVWSGAHVVEQLRQLGAMHVLHVALRSHDESIEHKKFLQKFRTLSKAPVRNTEYMQCVELVKEIVPRPLAFKVGPSLVLARSNVVRTLQNKIISRTSAILLAFIKGRASIEKVGKMSNPARGAVKQSIVSLKKLERVEISKRQCAQRDESRTRCFLVEGFQKRNAQLTKNSRHSIAMAQARFQHSIVDTENKKRSTVTACQAQAFRAIKEMYIKATKAIKYETAPSEVSTVDVPKYSDRAEKIAAKLIAHHSEVNTMTGNSATRSESAKKQQASHLHLKQVMFKKHVEEEKQKQEMLRRRLEKEDASRRASKESEIAKAKLLEQRACYEEQLRKKQQRKEMKYQLQLESRKSEIEWESVQRNLVKNVESALACERRHIKEKLAFQNTCDTRAKEEVIVQLAQESELIRNKHQDDLLQEEEVVETKRKKDARIGWEKRQQQLKSEKIREERDKLKRRVEWERTQLATMSLNALAEHPELYKDYSQSPIRDRRTVDGKWVPLSQRMGLAPPDPKLQPRYLGVINVKGK